MEEREHVRLDTFYRERVDEHDAAAPGYAAAWEKLTGLVLAHGGRLVVPPMDPEVHVELLTARLEMWPGRGARRRRGAPNRCHGNSAGLWLSEQVSEIATGYALSGDGLWRQHTWALDARGKVVETTVPREAYAGMLLSETEAIVFAAANVEEHDFTSALLAEGRAARIAREMLAAATGTGDLNDLGSP